MGRDARLLLMEQGPNRQLVFQGAKRGLGLSQLHVPVTLKHLPRRRPVTVPQPSASAVNHVQPLTAMKALALLSTLQSADIALATTTVARFASVASPNPPPSRNRFCCSSASASPKGFNSIANVVQTRRLPKLILNDLAGVRPRS